MSEASDSGGVLMELGSGSRSPTPLKVDKKRVQRTRIFKITGASTPPPLPSCGSSHAASSPSPSFDRKKCNDQTTPDRDLTDKKRFGMRVTGSSADKFAQWSRKNTDEAIEKKTTSRTSLEKSSHHTVSDDNPRVLRRSHSEKENGAPPRERRSSSVGSENVGSSGRLVDDVHAEEDSGLLRTATYSNSSTPTRKSSWSSRRKRSGGGTSSGRRRVVSDASSNDCAAEGSTVWLQGEVERLTRELSNAVDAVEKLTRSLTSLESDVSEFRRLAEHGVSDLHSANRENYKLIQDTDHRLSQQLFDLRVQQQVSNRGPTIRATFVDMGVLALVNLIGLIGTPVTFVVNKARRWARQMLWRSARPVDSPPGREDNYGIDGGPFPVNRLSIESDWYRFSAARSIGSLRRLTAGAPTSAGCGAMANTSARPG